MWIENFDRRLSIAIVDYSNIALGLGKIKVALYTIWADSAMLGREVEAQQKVGLVLTPNKVHGKLKNDKLIIASKFIMQVLQAQKAQNIRYVDAWVEEVGKDNQEAVLLLKSQFNSVKEQKSFSEAIKTDIIRVIQTLGITHFYISGPLWVETPTSDWNNSPLKMGQWGFFMNHMASISEERKRS